MMHICMHVYVYIYVCAYIYIYEVRPFDYEPNIFRITVISLKLVKAFLASNF